MRRWILSFGALVGAVALSSCEGDGNAGEPAPIVFPVSQIRYNRLNLGVPDAPGIHTFRGVCVDGVPPIAGVRKAALAIGGSCSTKSHREKLVQTFLGARENDSDANTTNRDQPGTFSCVLDQPGPLTADDAVEVLTVCITVDLDR